MDELPREAKSVLALAKSAQPSPKQGARERVRVRVDAAVAAAALTKSGNAGGSLGELGKSKSLLTTTKVMLASTALFIVTGGAWLATRAPVATRSEQPQATEVAATAQGGTAAQARRTSAPASTPPSPISSTSTLTATATATKHASSPSTQEPSPSLAAEMSLLSQAADALNNQDTSKARVLLSEHKKRFRHPQLREERDGLSLLTHCLERPDAAQGEARSFVHKNPAMMLAARIKQACGLHDQDGT